MYGIIYCATNLTNGKKYIGQTTKTLDERKNGHFNDINRHDYHFQRAIREHGWNNFCWETIDQAYSRKDLNDKEIFWVAFYKTFIDRDKGYNMTPGGEGGTLTEEIKEKIRQKKIGKTLSQEQKEKISVALKGKPKPRLKKSLYIFTPEHRASISKAMIGVPKSIEHKNKIKLIAQNRMLSEKTKNKISLSLIGNRRHPIKSVICIETQKIFLSIVQAAKEYGIADTHISDCCKGKAKTTGGYHWEYV